MATGINEKISLLPPEKQKEFQEELELILYHEPWFTRRGRTDYANPNVQEVKEILFKEKYAKYLDSKNNASKTL